MKCSHCGEEGGRMMPVPLFVTKTDESRNVVGIKDAAICYSCLVNVPSILLYRASEKFRRWEIVPQDSRNAAYVLYTFEGNPSRFCYKCGAGMGCDVSSASDSIVISGVKMPYWMRQRRSLDSVSRSRYVYKPACYAYAFINNHLTNSIHNVGSGTQYYIRTNHYIRALRVGGIDAPHQSGLMVEANDGRIGSPQSLLLEEAFLSAVQLCDDCHEEMGRKPCSICKRYTNDGPVCMVCRRMEDPNDVREDEVPSFTEGLRCACGAIDPPADSVSWREENALRYMVYHNNPFPKDCSCELVPKRRGYCFLCASGTHEFEEGTFGVCAACASTYKAPNISLSFRDNTFGSELEVISSDGSDYDEDDHDEDDGECDCSECRAERRRYSTGNHEDVRANFTSILGLTRREAGMLINFAGDGSLNAGGIEIKVGPLNHDKHLDKFREFVKYLNRLYYTDESCGGHIHLGGQHLEWWTVRDVVDYASRWEDEFFRAVPQGRRDSSYARKFNGCYVVDKVIASKNEDEFLRAMLHAPDRRFKTKARSADEICHLNGYDVGITGDRYYWLNFGSYFAHRTLEVRLLEGCLNEIRLGNWIQLWGEIINTFRNDCEAARKEALLVDPSTRMRELRLYDRSLYGGEY